MKAIHDLIRRVAFRNKSKAEVLAKAMLRIITEKATQQGVEPKEVIDALYNMKGRFMFGDHKDDILIGITGMDVTIKDKTARMVCQPKVRLFGRDGDDYVQLGMIQKFALAVDAENIEPFFEVVLPEHPKLSEPIQASIKKSRRLLKRSGASITYRKFE